MQPTCTHAHKHGLVRRPTTHRRLPPEPICCWRMFKYVNERLFRRPINVITFDIQHLHVWPRFPASDYTGRPELFEHRDMWSIRRTQPSVPSPGCDLIFGAAAGRGCLTAIKLGIILKKKGVRECWVWVGGAPKKKWGMMVMVQRDGESSLPHADICLPEDHSDKSASSSADEPFHT